MKRQQTRRQKQQKNNGISSALHSWYRQALKNTKYRWAVILGTLLYLVSPIDISPDVFPIIGWIDDGLIASLLITEVSQLMTEQLKRRRNFITSETTVNSITDSTLETEVETVVDTDNIKTINVEAVSVS